MASYHDAYDSRPAARRNDSYTRTRDTNSLKPQSGYASSPRESGVGHIDVHRSQSTSSYTTDAQYLYPPPPPPRVRSPRTPSRTRWTWPPRPTCEDEAASLAREARANILAKQVVEDGVQYRGTVDQEPLIQDVREHVEDDGRHLPRRSVGEERKGSPSIPTPPTSEDEKARRVRRRPSRLDTNLNQTVPDTSRRPASPYAFTKPTTLASTPSSSARFLSPNVMTPPLTDSGRGWHSQPSSPQLDSTRGSPSARKSGDYFSAGRASDEHAIDPDGDAKASVTPSRRRNTELDYSPTKSGSSPRTSVVDFAALPRDASHAKRIDLDARPRKDTGDMRPTLPATRVDKNRRATALLGASTLGGVAGSAIYSASATPPPTDKLLPLSREPSHSTPGGPSRGPSPVPAPNRKTSPLPRTSRYSSDVSPYSTNGSSATSSKTGSPAGSRPSSPSLRPKSNLPVLPKTDADWDTFLAANAARRTKPPSRLASSMRQESTHDISQSGHGSASLSTPTTSILPYPEDDGPGLMPSERGYQYFPDSKPSMPQAESAALHMAPRTVQLPARPIPQPTAASPTEERMKAVEQRSASFNTSPHTKRELAALLKKGLPDCSRPEPVSGFDDWYTAIGAPNVDFCPSCVESIFERTVFRPAIRRALPRSLNTEVRCALGSPWMRLAWLLTLQQERTDLALLKDLADIETGNDPCPGTREAVRPWYGLKDASGLFARDFHLCHADVRKIERLLPTLSGFFVRLPNRVSAGKRICAIRQQGNRFPTYINALISAHDAALTSRKPPDPMPVIELIEHQTRLRECTRDNMLLGGLWHFSPSIPSFTVCEDCYEAVIEPEVKKNNDVAMRFNRTVQPVYNEGMGSSCQLYSRRMVKIFRRAVEDGDLKYLARKANERREAEVRLQERYKDVVRRASRVSREGSGSEEEEVRLNKELQRITEEWQAKWE